MKKTNAKYATLALMGVSASMSMGAGFSLYEGSAAANADTAGVTAKGGEPGAIFFNPAAITGLEGTQLQFGTSLVVPHGKVSTTNPYTGEYDKNSNKETAWPLPHAYVTTRLSDDWWFGLGMYSRFGLGSEFKQNWPGRYNSYKAEIQSFVINPTLAWQATDWLSIGAGFSVQYFTIELRQKIDAAGALGMRNYNDASYSPYDVDQRLEGDDIGYGFNIGLQIKPIDRLNIGLAYHSRIKHNAEGTGEWKTPVAVQMAAPGMFGDTDLKSTVTLPETVMLAVTYDLTDALTIGGGVTYTGWSSYDKLVISLDTPIMPGRDKFISEKDWDDCWRYTFGGSYKLNENVVLRASYTYDDSPLNSAHIDYLVPADDRHLFAVGVGWTVGSWTFDASYIYEIISDFEFGARVKDGVYDSKLCDGYANIFGFSATKRF